MNTIKFTQDHINQAILEANFIKGKMDKEWIFIVCNKAIEIAIAEQSAQQKSEGCTRSHPHENMSKECEAKTIIAKANNEARCKELRDEQETCITAAQARELGAGNAEWSYNDTSNRWFLCTDQCIYPSYLKYRAVKQAPPEPVPYPRPFDPNLYCMVSKDGEPAIRMLRTEAQALFNKTHTTYVWTMPSCQGLTAIVSDEYLCAFDQQGTYTYRSKPAKVVAWADVPAGVMTNDGIFHGVFDDRGMAKRQGELPQYILFKDLELAPADQQPWIATQDFDAPCFMRFAEDLLAKGIAVKMHHSAAKYRITGIAEGWKL